MSVLSFAEVLSNHNMETTSTGNHCDVLPSRNWTVNLLNQVVESAGNKGSVIYLYRQDDCDFIGFNIIEVIPTKQNSFNDCVTHGLNVNRCTHFSYSSRDRRGFAT